MPKKLTLSRLITYLAGSAIPSKFPDALPGSPLILLQKQTKLFVATKNFLLFQKEDKIADHRRKSHNKTFIGSVVIQLRESEKQWRRLASIITTLMKS